MTNNLLKCIFFSILISISSISFGQDNSNTKLNAKSRTEIVNTISKLLIDNYVYLDTAKRMSEKIKLELKKGNYDKLTNPVDFSDRLVNDLYSVYHDGHLLVQYNPTFAAELADTTKKIAPSPQENLKRVKDVNYGFKKIEILMEILAI
jgi:hypothetical protein